MEIEFLWFDGCPNHQTARRLLQEVLAEAGIDTAVHEIRVDYEAAAVRRRFQGSPTSRINSIDVEPLSAEELPYGMACRIYQLSIGPQGYPAKDMIRSALETAVRDPWPACGRPRQQHRRRTTAPRNHTKPPRHTANSPLRT